MIVTECRSGLFMPSTALGSRGGGGGGGTTTVVRNDPRTRTSYVTRIPTRPQPSLNMAAGICASSTTLGAGAAFASGLYAADGNGVMAGAAAAVSGVSFTVAGVACSRV